MVIGTWQTTLEHEVVEAVNAAERVDHVKYYMFGGQKVAMSKQLENGTESVYYLHSDHLGSTSLTTDSSGAVTANARYFPYGGVRWSSSETKSEFGLGQLVRHG